VHEDRAAREDAAIIRFWTWWAHAGRALAGDAAHPDAFSSEVLPVLEDLDQAFSTNVIVGVFTGGAAERTTVLSYDADPERRGLGERWLAAAPPADAQVDFRVFPPSAVAP